MVDVLFVWTDCNPSTMEKNHLMMNGLVKAGLGVTAFGFIHTRKGRGMFEDNLADHALYEYRYGTPKTLHAGKTAITKLAGNIVIMFKFFISLYRYVKEKKIRTIILPPQPFELTLPVYLVSRLLRVRMIPNIMEYYPALESYNLRKNFFMRSSWKLVRNKSDSYIVISHALKDTVSKIYPEKPVFILPAIHGNEDQGSSNEVGHKEVIVPNLLFTSSNAYSDLLGFCIRSLSYIKDYDFIFTVTGSYTDDEISCWKQYARKYEVDEKLVFTGFISEKKLYSLERRSKALLIPLLNNEQHAARFPQKIMGYMSGGKPIITTNVGEIRYYFTDMENAFIASTVSEECYSKKIRYVLDHRNKAKTIGLKGAQYISDAFSYETWGKKLAGFIEEADH